MMSPPDVRWKQRLSNLKQALVQLASAVALTSTRKLSELEKQGLIQTFEFTHELAWNVMRDYFADQGNTSITGSRDAAREAFQNGLVLQGDVWMEMIKSRNQTSHTYNQVVADEIAHKIIHAYLPEFEAFEAKMNALAQK
jgi:nucleotidyltransferase substrate binding protein (TIGR01987 family)